MLSPGFVSSVLTPVTNHLGVCSSVRKSVKLAHEPNLYGQQVEHCFNFVFWNWYIIWYFYSFILYKFHSQSFTSAIMPFSMPLLLALVSTEVLLFKLSTLLCVYICTNKYARYRHLLPFGSTFLWIIVKCGFGSKKHWFICGCSVHWIVIELQK